MLFIIVFALICIQRLVELRVARNNERYMKSQGAIEFGQAHYKYIVMLHVAFLASFFIEYMVKESTLSPIWPWLLAVFIVLQLGRIWAIKSLGHFWNTKIIVLPNAQLVKKGPYKWIPHPNYVIVALEILVIPLIFQAYVTAIFFTLLNMLMMFVRIPEEERALNSIYKKQEQY
ncbi:isoprenylcysteine carboxyl methyltransferase [Rummeliibacillus stabekisii]|uniref:isoprenylcysteine carboxyl methyltransferase family protein n=1 Tax=Rummeliibacillus stabekisii TaxID=241244 RepID=UPI00203ACB98|nr:isoprenylcysteine carboxylmethyltransferase family protein [Rummeliibacillus stabekisii]MCM3317059.1 isoprenylcysteine carboxyl methyltransferase [Rummeliibacillus stabekisii]